MYVQNRPGCGKIRKSYKRGFQKMFQYITDKIREGGSGCSMIILLFYHYGDGAAAVLSDHRVYCQFHNNGTVQEFLKGSFTNRPGEQLEQVEEDLQNMAHECGKMIPCVCLSESRGQL